MTSKCMQLLLTPYVLPKAKPIPVLLHEHKYALIQSWLVKKLWLGHRLFCFAQSFVGVSSLIIGPPPMCGYIGYIALASSIFAEAG